MPNNPFNIQSDYPLIMGVLNVTPDSFSDGGRFIQGAGLDLNPACDAASDMIEQGAHIIDVGGESTRPGAKPVSLNEEMDRVLPVVEALAKHTRAIISVDTSSPELMIEAHKLGAGLLNDVRAFTKEGALDAAVSTQLPICIMHMQGNPQNMQDKPSYNDVAQDVASFLSSKCQQAIKAGVKPSHIMVDPGFGFGKTDTHNITLLQELDKIAQLGFPILAGLSRKSMIGRLLGRDTPDRLAGSLALAMLASQAGAGIIRVHDVAQTRDVLALQALIALDA